MDEYIDCDCGSRAEFDRVDYATWDTWVGEELANVYICEDCGEDYWIRDE